MSGQKKPTSPTWPALLAIGLSVAQLVLVVGLLLSDLPLIGDYQAELPPIILIVVGLQLSLLIIAVARLKKKSPQATQSKDLKKSDSVIEQASTIFNSIGEGVVVIDKQQLITFTNAEAQRLLGWSEAETLNIDYQNVLKLVNTQDVPVENNTNPIQQALINRKSQTNRNLMLKTMSGKNIPVGLTANPLDDGSDGVVVTFRNISLELEEERQQREFISTASHEMRTPVAAIEGYLGLVLNPTICTIDAKAQEYIAKAQEASKHLGELFRNLLSISKAEDGRMKTRIEVIELVQFVDQICDNFLKSAQAKNVVLKYLPTDQTGKTRLNPTIYVQADRNLLREAVTNLIENGIKYTTRGSVEVDVTIDQDKAVIRVTDSGIGIPPEDIPHLFQKFYRVDNSQTREVNGTGLGLYLTRRIVENLHGRIWVDSQLGQGSSFFISLARLGNREAEQIMQTEQVMPENDTNLFENPPKRQSYQVPEDYQPTPMSSYNTQATAEATPAVNSPDQTDNQPKPETNKTSNYQTATERTISASTASKLQALGYQTDNFQVVADSQAPTDPLTTITNETEKA